MIRVVLPQHLRTLARVDGEIAVKVPAPVTLEAILDAVEAAHPVLCGTIRDRATRRRRALVRFYACGEDLSNAPADTGVPAPVVTGDEPFMVVGAMAGG